MMRSQRLVQKQIDAHISAQCPEISLTLQQAGERPTDQKEAVALIRRNKRMSYKKLYKQIQLGFGQGHGRYYQPWLQIKRKNCSPKSNQVVAWLPPLNRVGHFFSRGEYHTALLFLWLAVHDLREQYPIWPAPHPHPLTGANEDDDTKWLWSRGLFAIAREAGIDHGYEIGTRQLYVATMDIVVTLKKGNRTGLFTFSSKPFDRPDLDIKWRTLERLELERRYAFEIGATHAVVASSFVPTLVAGQLEWWLDCSKLEAHPDLLSLADRFSEYVQRQNDWSIAEAVACASKKLSINVDGSWMLFRHCAWTQKIDIDPSKRVQTSYPIQRGGCALREELKALIFGEGW